MRQYKSVLGCSKSCEKGETSEPCSLLRTSAECRISQARWCLTAGGACPWAPPSSPPSVFTLCCCFLNMKHSQAWAGGRSWAPSDLQGRIFVNHTHLIDGDSCPGAGRGPCIGGRERASGDRMGAHFCTGVTTLPPEQLSPHLLSPCTPISVHAAPPWPLLAWEPWLVLSAPAVLHAGPQGSPQAAPGDQGRLRTGLGSALDVGAPSRPVGAGLVLAALGTGSVLCGEVGQCPCPEPAQP